MPIGQKASGARAALTTGCWAGCAMRSWPEPGARSQGFATDDCALPRVRGLIFKLGGPSFSTVHVWRLLGRMAFSPQGPTGRARERDEQVIADWKSRGWSKLKRS